MSTATAEQLETSSPFYFRSDRYRKDIAERARHDLRFFIRHMWGAVCLDSSMMWNWHLDEMSLVLMEEARRVGRRLPKRYDLIFNVPPGTTKSITGTIMFPVWCWTNWFWMRFITASYSDQLATKHSFLSRRLIESDKFQEIFPEIRIDSLRKRKDDFGIEWKAPLTGSWRLGGERFAASKTGTVTGTHSSMIITDDPLNPIESASDKERATANVWYSETLSSRKASKVGTLMILIMQRLHEMDVTGHVLDTRKASRIYHMCLPAEIFSEKARQAVKPERLVDFYRDGLLDPVRMPKDVLEDMEADLGPYGYASQMLQIPSPPKGGVFKPDEMPVLDAYPDPATLDRVVRYWDKAGTDKLKNPDSAYTAGVKMGYLKHEKKFVILDVVRGQWDAAVREARIKATAKLDGLGVSVYVEQEPGAGGKESAETTIKNLAGYKVHADRPTGNKALRAQPLSSQLNVGHVYMVKAPWNKRLVEELRMFPNGAFKDQVDAAGGAFSKVVRKRRVRAITR